MIASYLEVRGNELFEGNLRLVYSYVARFLSAKQSVKDSEEYSDALIALWQAADTWNPSLGMFSTYARRCMHNAIISGRRSRKYNLVQINQEPEAPQNIKQEISELLECSAVDRWHDANGGTVSNRVVCQAKQALYDYYVAGMTLEEVGCSQKVSRRRAGQLVEMAKTMLKKEVYNVS